MLETNNKEYGNYFLTKNKQDTTFIPTALHDIQTKGVGIWPKS